MNAIAIARILNAALSVIAGIRQLGVATDDINERLARVDEGGEGITAEEVEAQLDEFGDEIERGRGL